MAADFETYFRENRQRHLEELFGFLRIPSISALPDHQTNVERAAEWVADKLRIAGMPRVEMRFRQ